MDPTRVPVGIDHSTFFTPQIPETVLATVPLLHTLSAADQAVIVEEALALYLSVDRRLSLDVGNGILRPETLKHVADTDYGRCSTVQCLVVALLQFLLEYGAFAFHWFTICHSVLFFSSLLCSVAVVVSGVYDIVKTALRVKVHSSILGDNLRAMFLPDSFTAALVSAVGKQRVRLEDSALTQRVRLPTLAALRWRVDVCISSGLLSRVMRPNIMLQCVLSSGEIKTFEVSVEQFNQLRYGVAKVLHDMQMLDRHPIMRVVKELERKDADDRQKK